MAKEPERAPWGGPLLFLNLDRGALGEGWRRAWTRSCLRTSSRQDPCFLDALDFGDSADRRDLVEALFVQMSSMFFAVGAGAFAQVKSELVTQCS